MPSTRAAEALARAALALMLSAGWVVRVGVTIPYENARDLPIDAAYALRDLRAAGATAESVAYANGEHGLSRAFYWRDIDAFLAGHGLP